ncbi:MAG: glycosyltransferase [Gemmatimonadetes bacterium]|nr:glycosyltransferase [Gemmatimonadota bacterium]
MSGAATAAGPPRVLAAVLNFNGKPHLQALLPTLAAQDYPRLSLLVVDNASTDGSLAWVRAAHPEVAVLPRARNDGYAALNDAIDEARRQDAEFVFLMTNDLRLDPRCVSHAVRAMRDDARLGIVGFHMLGAVRWVDPAALDEASARWDGLRVEDRGWVEGAAMFCRRRVFDVLGGIDPVYFVYAEEDDLQYRARAAGFRVAGVNTPVWHNAGRNVLAETPARSAYLQMRNLIRYRAKNHGMWMGLKTAARVAVNACGPRDTADRTVPFEARLRPFGPARNAPLVARAIGWNLLHLPQTLAARGRDLSRVRQARRQLAAPR